MNELLQMITALSNRLKIAEEKIAQQESARTATDAGLIAFIATQSVGITGDPQSITVPKNPDGTVVLDVSSVGPKLFPFYNLP